MSFQNKYKSFKKKCVLFDLIQLLVILILSDQMVKKTCFYDFHDCMFCFLRDFGDFMFVVGCLY